MFETALFASSPDQQPRSRWPALLSFATQAIVVAALIAIPLLHPEVLPLATPKLELLAPRFRPQPPRPPIPQPVRIQTATASSAPAAPTQAVSLPPQAFRSAAQAVDAPALPVGLNISATGPNPLSALLGSAPTGSPVTVVGPAAGHSTAPVRITTGVLAGMLLAPIRPQYPAIARITRTEGTVVIEAIISRTGQIESAHVLSGPEMLRATALQAVRDARYRPFLLNGSPTEVSTTVSINFRLAGA